MENIFKCNKKSLYATLIFPQETKGIDFQLKFYLNFSKNFAWPAQPKEHKKEKAKPMNENELDSREHYI